MPKKNKSFDSKPCSSTSLHNNGGNSGDEQSLIELLRGKLNISSVYSGKKGESTDEFLRQFLRVEDDWTSERLLKNVKASLKGKALSWYEAFEDEFKNYPTFKNMFKEEFDVVVEDSDERLFWNIIYQGPKEDISDFCYRLKKTAKGDIKKFEYSREELIKHLPNELRREGKKLNNWKEMICFLKEEEEFINKVISRRSSSFKRNIEANTKKFNIPVKSENTCESQGKGPVGKSSNSVGDDKNRGDKKCYMIVKASVEKKNEDLRPRITLEMGTEKLNALLDTGASVSVISVKTAERFKLNCDRKTGELRGVNGIFETIGSTKVNIKKVRTKKKLEVEFLVVSDMNEEAILGISDIQKLNLFPFITRQSKGQPVITSAEVCVTDAKVDNKNEEMIDIGDYKVGEVWREKCRKLAQEFDGLFYKPGRPIKLMLEHKIRTLEDKGYLKCAKYRRSREENTIINNEVQNLLSKGLIKESTSSYLSPVVLVRKKDDSIRFCIDYRKLNSITVKEEYPIPRIDDAIDVLGSAKIFSSLDLESGYHQIRVRKEDQHKTAFMTREGCYEWLRMPFGLVNAPFTFQKVMNSILSKFLYKYVIVYLDDILIFSKNEEEHLIHLKRILEILDDIGFKVNVKKCKLLKSEIMFLGYVITDGKIHIPLARKSKALNFERPKSKKDVRRFIGFTGYFRKFIKDYAHVMSPLYDLTRNVKFRWDEKAEEAFKTLKMKIRDSIGLCLPNFEKRFFVYADASELSIGGSLVQRVDDSEFPIFFISRRLNKAEMNYTVTEKECLAIIWSIKQFRIYLCNEFTIRTDHQALKWLLDLKDAFGRVMRWNLYLQEFNYKIEYIKGSKNYIADFLSRQAVNSMELMEVTEKHGEEPDILRIRKIHEDLGHAGIVTTYIYLSKEGPWKGMYKDVVSAVNQCEICKKFARKNAKLKIHRMELEYPFRKMGIDLVGPLPTSYRGNKYIIIATDYLTRWAEAKPLKSKSMDGIAKFIISICCIHGPPEELLSDRGKEFLNNIVKKVCLLLNIRKTYTAAFNPKCNGAVERLNQTLISKLVRLCNERWKEWDDFLEFAVFAYRISPRSKSKVSPFELIYGRRPRSFSDFTVIETDFLKEDNTLLVERLKFILGNLHEMERDIRRREIKEDYKLDNTDDLFVNDVVLRRKQDNEVLNKFDSKWKGPFIITKVLGNGGYRIKDPFDLEFVVNRKDLQLVDQTENEEWKTSPEERRMSCNRSFKLNDL